MRQNLDIHKRAIDELAGASVALSLSGRWRARRRGRDSTMLGSGIDETSTDGIGGTALHWAPSSGCAGVLCNERPRRIRFVIRTFAGVVNRIPMTGIASRFAAGASPRYPAE
jgi:hypothetical protein